MRFITVLLIFILFVLPIIALIYTFLTWYIPLVFLNIIITIGAGLLMGQLVSRIVIRFGKVRNSGIAVFVSITASAVMLYLSWIVWTSLQINTYDTFHFGRLSISKSFTTQAHLLELLLNPSEVIALIQDIHDNGTWTLTTKQNHEGGGAVRGGFLTITWCIEALIIFLLPIRQTFNYSKSPFDEENNE